MRGAARGALQGEVVGAVEFRAHGGSDEEGRLPEWWWHDILNVFTPWCH